MTHTPKAVSVAIIGHGSLGRALAVTLNDLPAGALSSLTVHTRRDPGAMEAPYTVRKGFPGGRSVDPRPDWVFLCVPDDALPRVAADLAQKMGERVADISFIHTSGAQPAAILQALATKGAPTAAMHPIQTFPSIAGDPEPSSRLFRALPISLQGDPGLCDRLASFLRVRLGADPFIVTPEQKEALHLAAVLASNAVVPLLSAARGILLQAQLPEGFARLLPLLSQTALNVDAHGPDALTGPVKRGDSTTVERHLRRLAGRPDLLSTYVAASRSMLRLAAPDGNVTPGQKRIEELLNAFETRTQPPGDVTDRSEAPTRASIYERIYDVVRRIPEGRVSTYGAIARAVGPASGARMVGYALNNLLHAEARGEALDVPAHRVVNRLGQLTGRGYFYGDSMRERLLQEGIRFIEDYTVDMEAHRWEPPHDESATDTPRRP